MRQQFLSYIQPLFQNRSRTRLIVTGIAIAALLAVVALAAMNAAANPRSAAEVRVGAWVNALRDDKLTVARQDAQMNLEAAAELAVPQLTAALRSDSAAQRRNAAEMLGYIASRQATDALRRALASDSVPAVRRNAAWALGEIKDPRAMNDLKQAAVTDGSQMVRGSAADSLARIRTVLAQAIGVNEQLVGAIGVAPSEPNELFVAEKRDLHVSTDGGVTWSVLSNALPSQVSALAVSPKNIQEIYIGVEGMGMYKSADGGKTWSALNTGITLTPGAREVISAIAIDPLDANVIYIARGVWLGTGKVEFYPVGLMASRDGGNSWQALNAGSSAQAIAQLAFREGQLYGLAGDRVFTLVTPQ